MNQWPNPFIEQHADPFILRNGNHYYFITSVPEYDRLETRRTDSLKRLRTTAPVVVWCKPEGDPTSQLIWAPEIHRLAGKRYIYFAATHTQSLGKLKMSQHRMFVSECVDADPLAGQQTERGQIKTQFGTFALDTTIFNHQGKQWYLWAQEFPGIAGNSNIYLAELESPQTIKDEPAMLSHPECDWGCQGFWVNEGPAVMAHDDKLFISYSASAIGENCCMGLLWIDLNADPLSPQNWRRSPCPVFIASYENHQFGPGYGSLTQTPKGEDVLVYRARDYTEIRDDSLYSPNRHARLKLTRWGENNMPDFDMPSADTN